MPKLQKQLSRKKGKKTYYKYVVTIPPEIIKEKGIKEGDEIEIDIAKIIKISDKKLKETKNVRKVRTKNSDS